MFTGIIENVVSVLEVSPQSSREVLLKIPNPFSDVKPGESIAVNGVCLTAVAEKSVAKDFLLFYVSPETLDRSNLSQVKVGDKVNLERALRLEDRLSGHLVQGHVDGMAKIMRMDRSADQAHELEVQVPEALLKYMVEKGSVCLDGISLTINSINKTSICLMIIPHTWEHTNLSSKQVGRDLNIEADMVAKHLYAFYSRGH